MLPHLRQMVEIVEHGLVDEQQKVSVLASARFSAFYVFFFFLRFYRKSGISAVS